MLSDHVEDVHQMYFEGSVVGTFNNWYRDLAHPSPNFHRGQKVRNLPSFKTSLKLSRPHLKMQLGIRIVKQKCNAVMITLCPG